MLTAWWPSFQRLLAVTAAGDAVTPLQPWWVWQSGAGEWPRAGQQPGSRQEGRVDGAGRRRQEDVPLPLAWPRAWSLSRGWLGSSSFLCSSLPETQSHHTPAPSRASPDGFLLLQASGLLSVKDRSADRTFLMPEASQIVQPVQSL